LTKLVKIRSEGCSALPDRHVSDGKGSYQQGDICRDVVPD